MSRKIVLFTALLILSVHFPYAQFISGKDSIIPLKANLQNSAIQIESLDLTRPLCVKPLAEEPLFILDGILCASNELKNVDPRNIFSINILKAGAAKISCHSSGRSMIIITTKKLNETKLVVKNFLTGNPIPGATIQLTNAENNDTTLLIADDSGEVVVNTIAVNKVYAIGVTSVGYKPLSEYFENKSGAPIKEIYLVPQVKLLQNVVVAANSRCCICRKLWKACAIKADSSLPAENFVYPRAKIYPNPVQRSQSININLATNDEQYLSVRLFDMNGQLLTEKEFGKVAGNTVFEIPTDSRWPAGVYSVMIIAGGGTLLKSEQVILK